MLHFLTNYIIIYTLTTSMHRVVFLQYTQICIALWQQLNTPKQLLVIFYTHKKTTIPNLKWIYHSQSATITCLFSTTAFHFHMPKQHLVQFLPVLLHYFSSNIICLFCKQASSCLHSWNRGQKFSLRLFSKRPELLLNTGKKHQNLKP